MTTTVLLGERDIKHKAPFSGSWWRIFQPNFVECSKRYPLLVPTKKCLSLSTGPRARKFLGKSLPGEKPCTKWNSVFIWTLRGWRRETNLALSLWGQRKPVRMNRFILAYGQQWRKSDGRISSPSDLFGTNTQVRNDEVKSGGDILVPQLYRLDSHRNSKYFALRVQRSHFGTLPGGSRFCKWHPLRL